MSVNVIEPTIAEENIFSSMPILSNESNKDNLNPCLVVIITSFITKFPPMFLLKESLVFRVKGADSNPTLSVLFPKGYGKL